MFVRQQLLPLRRQHCEALTMIVLHRTQPARWRKIPFEDTVRCVVQRQQQNGEKPDDERNVCQVLEWFLGGDLADSSSAANTAISCDVRATSTRSRRNAISLGSILPSP